MVPTQPWTPKQRIFQAIGWLAMLILGACAAMTVFALFAALAVGGFGPTKEDVTGDWPRFYEARVKYYFWIPPEAKIRHAEQREEIMGGGFLVVFTLPKGKEPERWLKFMAQKSKIYPYRKSKFKFDAGGDITRLEYFPARGEFEAEFIWD